MSLKHYSDVCVTGRIPAACCRHSALDESSQTAVEEELSSLQRFLFLLRLAERLAASELAGDDTSVVVAVGVLQVAPCTEQRSVQLQHGAAGPAAHRGELSESYTHIPTGQGVKTQTVILKATTSTVLLHMQRERKQEVE